MSDLSHPNRRFLLSGAAALTLSACSSLIGPTADQQLYVLKPTFAKSRGPAIRWRLAVSRPDAPDGIDNNRISISRTPTTMDYYADCAWTDRLSMLVQQLTVEAFEASGRIASVAAESVGAHADYQLDLDIRNFEARYDTPDGPPVAVVRMHAKLITQLKQNILGDFDTVHEAQASQNSIDSAVLALDQAFSAALADIVDWTLRTGVPVPA